MRINRAATFDMPPSRSKTSKTCRHDPDWAGLAKYKLKIFLIFEIRKLVMLLSPEYKKRRISRLWIQVQQATFFPFASIRHFPILLGIPQAA
jgi:hypothetical protein